jgi:predicted GIY-YIG superfamily endonuclease
MPRTPVDYSKTLIYKLVHKEDYDNENIYIGSTTDFVKRKNSHKSCCNSENNKEHNNKKYQYIRNNGGWNEWNMIEIEKYNCNDGNEARAREEYWRCYFNSQLNMVRAYRTEEQKKEYYEQNKDKILEQQKENKKLNKDKIIEQMKERYEQNKDNILEKITCECGCVITKCYLAKHQKTQKHLLLTKQIKYEFVDDNDVN